MTDQKKSTVLIVLIATTAFFVLRPANALSPYPRPTSQPVPTVRYDEIVLPTIGADATAELRTVTDGSVDAVSDPIPDAATIHATTDLLTSVAANPAARDTLIAWISERLPSATGALLALFTALLGVLVAARERVAAVTRETWTDVTRTVTTPVTTTATRMIARLVEVVTTVPRTVVDTVTTMVERVTPVVRSVPRTVVETIEQIVPRTVDVLRHVPRTVVDTVTRVVPRVVEVVRSVPRTVTDWVTALVATTVPVVRTVTDMVPRMVQETFSYPVQVARTVYDTVMTSVREFVQVTKQVARTVVEWVQPTLLRQGSGGQAIGGAGTIALPFPTEGLFRSRTDPDTIFFRTGGKMGFFTIDMFLPTNRSAANMRRLGIPVYGSAVDPAWYLDQQLNALGMTRAQWDALPEFNGANFGSIAQMNREGAAGADWMNVVGRNAAVIAAAIRPLVGRATGTGTYIGQLPSAGSLAASVGVAAGAYQTPQPVVKTVYDTVVETVERWVEKPVQVARTVFDTVWRTGARMVEQIVPVVRTVTEMVTTAVPTLVERLRTVVDTVREAVTEVVTETAQVARTVWDTVKDTITELVRVPVTMTRTIYDAVTEYVREMVPVVTTIPRTVYDTVVNSVPRMVAETYAETNTVVTTVTERVKKTIAPSVTAVAWALVGVRGEIERVGRKIAGADGAPVRALFPALGLVQQVVTPASTLRSIAADALHGMTRSIGSAGVTIAGALYGETIDPVTIADFPAVVQPIAAAILTDAPVASIEQRIAVAELMLRDWGNRMRTSDGSPSVRTIGALVGDHATLLAIPAILGSVGMDLTPFGGLESGGAKAIVRATTRTEAIAVLRRLGAGETLAAAFADDAVRAATDGAATTLLRRLAGEMDAVRGVGNGVAETLRASLSRVTDIRSGIAEAQKLAYPKTSKGVLVLPGDTALGKGWFDNMTRGWTELPPTNPDVLTRISPDGLTTVNYRIVSKHSAQTPFTRIEATIDVKSRGSAREHFSDVFEGEDSVAIKFAQ